jgi:hypothetical protein
MHNRAHALGQHHRFIAGNAEPAGNGQRGLGEIRIGVQAPTFELTDHTLGRVWRW